MDAWADLDEVDLGEKFLLCVSVLQNCPSSMKGRWKYLVRWILDKRSEFKQQEYRLGVLRGRKLFRLMPMMLLRKTRLRGVERRRVLEQRFDDFLKSTIGRILLEDIDQEVASNRQTLAGCICRLRK